MNSLRPLAVSLVCLFSLGLTACGGGGGGSSTSTSTISGTVATGAPMISGGVISIYDANGKLVGSTTTDDSGVYSLAGIDTSQFTAPFTVKAVGTIGDSIITLTSITDSAGTANVNQVTHAIATSLASDGNAVNLAAGGHGITAASIIATEQNFSDALKALKDNFSTTSSFIKGTHDSNFDGMLDNIVAAVAPDGTIDLSSTSGMDVSDSIGSQSSGSGSAFTRKSLAKNEKPSAGDRSLLAAPNAKLTAALLEPLRAQLETCFNNTAASRATVASGSGGNPTWNIAETNCNNLATSDFLDSSFKWIDTSSKCTSGYAYCLGYFGSMLTATTTYDYLKFLKPTHIRPAGTNLWEVQFPVQYKDGTLGQFGDIVSDISTIVKLDSDGKYRFYGNQREVNSFAQAVVQKETNAITGATRYTTGINMYISPYSSRALSTPGSTYVWPVKAVVTGRGLPTDGVTLANKVNRATSGSVGVSSNSSSTYNLCGGYMSIEFKDYIPNFTAPGTGDYTSANVSALGGGKTISSCSGVLRLAYVVTKGSYTPSATSTSYLSAWNSDGTFNSAGTTPMLADTGTGGAVGLANLKLGEPYKFVITFSDGSSKTYINHLTHSLVTTAQATLLNMPTFTSDTTSRFATYNGNTASQFASAWDKFDGGNIFGVALLWAKAANSFTAFLPLGTLSNTFTCSNSGSPACNASSSWMVGSSPDQGILQLKSRTFDGLQLFSQIRQY